MQKSGPAQALIPIPDKLLHVIERSLVWKSNLAHRFADVKQTRKRLLLFDKLVVVGFSRWVIETSANKRVCSVCLGKSSVDEAETRIFGDEHEIKDAGIAIRERDWSKARLLKPIRPHEHSVVITQVVKKTELKRSYQVSRCNHETAESDDRRLS